MFIVENFKYQFHPQTFEQMLVRPYRGPVGWQFSYFLSLKQYEEPLRTQKIITEDFSRKRWFKRWPVSRSSSRSLYGVKAYLMIGYAALRKCITKNDSECIEPIRQTGLQITRSRDNVFRCNFIMHGTVVMVERNKTEDSLVICSFYQIYYIVNRFNVGYFKKIPMLLVIIFGSSSVCDLRHILELFSFY